MASPTEARRRVVFAVAVAILVFGFLAIRVLGDRGDAPEGGVAQPAVSDTGPLTGGRDGTADAAIEASRSFLRAYLNFQVGILNAGDRTAIRNTALPGLREQLLGVPARANPAAGSARERIQEMSEISVGLEGGEPALRIGWVVAGVGGKRVLTVTLLRRASGWRVAEVGS